MHYLPTGVYLLAAANSDCRVTPCSVVCDSCQATSWAHPIHVSHILPSEVLQHKIRRMLFTHSEQVRPIYLPVPRRTTHRI